MSVFPDIVRRLPEAGLSIDGLTIHISHSDTHEVWFLHSETPVDYPPHAHSAQWGIVLAGEIEIAMQGKRRCFTKGDSYYLPKGVEHSVKMSAGYAEIIFVNEPDFLGRTAAASRAID
jgi:mannose-6-phosphate isomerase-like protein (cupin superfamily)